MFIEYSLQKVYIKNYIIGQTITFLPDEKHPVSYMGEIR